MIWLTFLFLQIGRQFVAPRETWFLGLVHVAQSLRNVWQETIKNTHLTSHFDEDSCKQLQENHLCAQVSPKWIYRMIHSDVFVFACIAMVHIIILFLSFGLEVFFCLKFVSPATEKTRREVSPFILQTADEFDNNVRTSRNGVFSRTSRTDMQMRTPENNACSDSNGYKTRNIPVWNNDKTLIDDSKENTPSNVNSSKQIISSVKSSSLFENTCARCWNR